MGTSLIVAFALVPVVAGVVWLIVALFDRLTHRPGDKVPGRDKWGESLAWIWTRN